MGRIECRRSCAGCRYRRPMSEKKPVLWACQYILMTGHSRGCSAECCDRYELQPLTAEDCE